MHQTQLILDNISRTYPYRSTRSIEYVNSLNEVLRQSNNFSSIVFTNIHSHEFYNTIRKLIQDLLIDYDRLHSNETYLLRNSVRFFEHFITNPNIYVVYFFHWSFLNSFARCLSHIDEINGNFKSIVNLFHLLLIAYRSLPISQQKDSKFAQLFESIIDCLTSNEYDRCFRQLKSSMKTRERFFLIQCPTFLCSKPDKHSTTIIEQILEILVARYASILDQHIKSLEHWDSSMIHAVNHLVSVVLLAKNHYSNYATGQPLQWLIDHLIHILEHRSFTRNIDSKCRNLLIESILHLLSAFVRDSDLLIYIKQTNIQSFIHLYSSSRNEFIVYYTYVILSFIFNENDIVTSEKESKRLLTNIFDSLRKKIRLYKRDPTVEPQIALLVEAIQVLVQHDQIKSEILRQHTLPLLIDNFQIFDDRSQRLILETIGSMTFYNEAAKVLKENKQFLDSVENKKTTINDGVRKAADKIIWNLNKEPDRIAKAKTDEFLYDIMISYCHADKDLVHKIHRYLADKGLKIWIDREQMYGPAMQAMAQAVENSEFVILCMSSAYKRSVYCQAEAEYAFQCKRRLLPLIVRQEYRPDGWLGLLLGSRIYVDFGKLDFQTACQSLLNEMSLQRKAQVPETKSEQIDASSEQTTDVYKDRDTSSSTYNSKDLNQWLSDDILDFLFDSKLSLMMPLCETLNGQGLVKLFRMCQRQPTHFYAQLNEELNSTCHTLLPMGVYTQFLTEIESRLGASKRSSVNSQSSIY